MKAKVWSGSAAAIVLALSNLLVTIPAYATPAASVLGGASAIGGAIAPSGMFDAAPSGIETTAPPLAAKQVETKGSTTLPLADLDDVQAVVTACGRDNQTPSQVIVPQDADHVYPSVNLLHMSDKSGEDNSIQTFTLPFLGFNADGTPIQPNGGMVPGDCGTLILDVMNSGTRAAQLTTYIKAINIDGIDSTLSPTDPAFLAQVAAVQNNEELFNFYETASFMVSSRSGGTREQNVWNLSVAEMPSQRACGEGRCGPFQYTTRTGANVGPFYAQKIDQQCVAVEDTAHVSVTYDFPVGTNFVTDPATGIITATATGPQSAGNYSEPIVTFQLYLTMIDNGDTCGAPDLKVAVSDNTPASDSSVMWTVTAQNAATASATDCVGVTVNTEDIPDGTCDEAATNTYVYLIVDGKVDAAHPIITDPPSTGKLVIWDDDLSAHTPAHPDGLPQIWDPTCFPADTTSSSVADTGCFRNYGYREPNYAAGETFWIADPNSIDATDSKVDKYLVVWQVGTLAPGETQSLNIYMSTSADVLDWDGDVCVTAFISSDDEPYLAPSPKGSDQVDMATGLPVWSTVPIPGYWTPSATQTGAITWVPSGGYTFPWLPAYDWAKHHYVEIAPFNGFTYDAGYRNNTSVALDTDMWDYNGYRPIPPNPIKDHPRHCGDGQDGACLEVAVSQYSYNRGNITWQVTAKNSGTMSADPVQVELAVDGLLTVPWDKKKANPDSSIGIWVPSGTNILCPAADKCSTPGIYEDNQHVIWELWTMGPGATAVLTITVPAADVTWDGDICVTAVISSPMNPLVNGTVAADSKSYPGVWPLDVQARYLAVGVNGQPVNDIDDDDFKGHSDLPYGRIGMLQRNNGNPPNALTYPKDFTKTAATCVGTDLNCHDLDQWDYNGWYSDNPTTLKVSVSESYMVGDYVTFKVWAKNAGTERTQGAGKVEVKLAIDARTDVAAWGAFEPSQGSVGRWVDGVQQAIIEPGVYKQNNHVYWEVGHLEPGQVETLVISIPAADVTWDGDICVTAVISSPGTTYFAGNPFTANWTAAQIAILNGPAFDGGKQIAAHSDIDDDLLKVSKLYSNDDLVSANAQLRFLGLATLPTLDNPTYHLQQNNSYINQGRRFDRINVDADTDQWDYYGWRATPAGASRATRPLSKTGVSGLIVLVAAGLGMAGRQLAGSRRKPDAASAA